jgi:hypothetical protein
MDDRVRFEVGPVAATAAAAWLTNSRQLLDGVRREARALPIRVDDALVDFLDALLSAWEGVVATGGDADFHWESTTSRLQLRAFAEQWVEIGSLGDDDLARIGARWAPEEARPMSEAVADAVLAALSELGTEGEDLVRRIKRDPQAH